MKSSTKKRKLIKRAAKLLRRDKLTVVRSSEAFRSGPPPPWMRRL